MNFQKIIIFIIVAVLVAGGGWYLMHDDSAMRATTDDGRVDETERYAPSSVTDAEDYAGSGSFAGLIMRGEDMTCEFSYSDIEGTSGSGVAYFTENMMRVESKITAEGVVYVSTMIDDGETAYTWSTSEAGDYAIQMPSSYVDAAGAVQYEDVPDETGESFDFDQEVDYTCERWSVDERVFVPPSDVEFMDMANMFEGVPAEMQEAYLETYLNVQ